MTARLANVSLWVRDQEEAKQFYTQQLGWEVRSDYSLPERTAGRPVRHRNGI